MKSTVCSENCIFIKIRWSLSISYIFVDCNLHFVSAKKVENVDIKSFMPKELNGFANRLNVKKNVVHYFDTWRDKDAAFVHERYLSKVRSQIVLHVLKVLHG